MTEEKCWHSWRMMSPERTQDPTYMQSHGARLHSWLWYCTKCRLVERETVKQVKVRDDD